MSIHHTYARKENKKAINNNNNYVCVQNKYSNINSIGWQFAAYKNDIRKKNWNITPP